MKEKVNQMFKDKLFLVMLVLGLLTIVAAAGVVTIQKGNQTEENPYMEIEGTEGFLAEEIVPEELDSQSSLAGNSNAAEEENQVLAEAVPETNPAITPAASEEPAAAAGTAKEAAKALVLDFTDTSKLSWPVQGNVLLDYSMDTTIYFPTLDQYKCNPALVIQSDVSTPVYAPANARVAEVGRNEEIGEYLKLDLGGEYTAVCGQLKEIQVVANEYLEKGQLLGYVSEPTKYYTIEGNNFYLEMKKGDALVDPLDYLE